MKWGLLTMFLDLVVLITSCWHTHVLIRVPHSALHNTAYLPQLRSATMPGATWLKRLFIRLISCTPHCHTRTQLDGSNWDRRLDWPPLERLSKQVHMVISTLPDELSPPDGHPFCCLSQLERRLVGSNTGRRQFCLMPLAASAGETTDLSRLAREHPQVFVRVEPLQDAADLLWHLFKLQGATPRRSR